MDFDAAEFELDLPARVPAVDAAATPAEPIRLPEISWDLDVGELLPLPETREGPAVPLDEGESVPDQPAPQTAAVEDEEPVKIIGDLRVGIPLFNIYLNEADELSRRLVTELAEWSLELYRPAGDSAVVLAHSLAGSSATVGFLGLSQLARSLEHALTRSNDRPPGAASEVEVFSHAAEEIRRLLHQFAAGFLREPDADLIRRLVELEHAPIPLAQETADLFETEEEAFFAQADPGEVETAASDLAAAESVAPELPPAAVEEVFEQLGQPALMPFAALTDAAQRPSPARAGAPGLDDDIDAVDALDAELFPIFDDEANDLVPQLHARLREWAGQPNQAVAASACLRTLHTLKGGARLAGAMRLGEMAHRIEGAIEQLLARSEVDATDVHRLVAYADSLEAHLESLRQGDSAAPPPPPPPSIEWVNAVDASPPTVAVVPVDGQAQDADALADAKSKRSGLPPSAEPPTPAPVASAMIDWSLFLGDASAAERAAPRVASALSSSTAAVRVRAPLLDRLVNHAGEVSITRARIEADVDQMKDSLRDLDENLGRLRHQLRDIELQAEIQIGTRLEAARAAALEFDPLEMDRFTRFQEITRMMAESVSDVATVQRGLQRTLQSTEDELARQARLTRDLQDDLLRTRMVEFDGLSERLYRVVRQAAKETGKQVRLDITGGSIEIDRGVLDRVTGAFEHVLRNSVVHGIEPTAERIAAGKEAIGTIAIAVTQEGNEVAIDFRDDGAGLALQRIRDKAIALGLLDAQADVGEAELAALIFHSGVTTVDEVTDLAGRGVGMDVVRADVSAMGGRIETATASGQGTSVKLVLPLTTAVTQVVMMRCGDLIVAVPSTLVEIVRRVPAAELPGLYAHGVYRHGDAELPFYWLASLLQGRSFGSATGRTVALVVIRSAAQRIAVHVDEVLRNQEVVVKNLGPQLARLPGLAGMTLLPSGAPALIYNPVALATLYGRASRGATLAALAAANQVSRLAHEAAVVPQAPLVMVVDDSLTVRRVTQRLLVREGYRVVVAKDGLEGLQRLGEELPALVLTDIEMPRMDGFDLVRNMRVDPRLAGLPVIMITSRIAQKHRDYAAELGVEHYLGKPYVEQDLLALVEHYTAKAAD